MEDFVGGDGSHRGWKRVRNFRNGETLIPHLLIYSKLENFKPLNTDLPFLIILKNKILVESFQKCPTRPTNF